MKASFFVLMSLFTCSLIYPQENQINPKYALSFGITDNFRLDSFYMDIAVKKIIDESNQLRLFLSPRISIRNQDETVSGDIQSQEAESSSFSLGIGADYLWILLTNEDINMFGGTGLIAGYGIEKSDLTTINNDGSKSISEISSPSTSIGIRGTLGVEWRVSQKIGIHSEYLVTGLYMWNKSEKKSSSMGEDNFTATRTATQISLSSGVLFGISIYL